MAVASAGSYANNLHLAADKPRQYLTTQFLQAACPSCRPTNSGLNTDCRLNCVCHFNLLSNHCCLLYRQIVPLLPSLPNSSFQERCLSRWLDWQPLQHSLVSYSMFYCQVHTRTLQRTPNTTFLVLRISFIARATLASACRPISCRDVVCLSVPPSVCHKSLFY